MPFQDRQTQISLRELADRLQSPRQDTMRVRVRTCVDWQALLMHAIVSAASRTASWQDTLISTRTMLMFFLPSFLKHDISCVNVILGQLKNVRTFVCQYVSHNVSYTVT